MGKKVCKKSNDTGNGVAGGTKSGKEPRFRVFNVLQYEVNPKTGQSLNFTEQNILSCISHKTINRYAYICHDKDTVTEADIETGKGNYDENDLGKTKGKHWHIVIECEKTPLPISTIAKWLGIPENMVEVPKGRGAFIDCVEYLRHSDIHQALKGKYEYDASEVKANFDWEAEVTQLVLRKTKYERPLSEEEYLKNEVLYNGLTLQEVFEKYPTIYQKEMQIFKKLRLEYLATNAQVPKYRVNYYLEGNSGYGKDTMAYSIARALYPGLTDEAYFEVGSRKVTFDGYDGEPVIIWSEWRAETFLKNFDGYENVLSTIDIIPKKKKREHKKFGDLRLVNAVNIITSTQPYEEFLKNLIPDNDPDPTQANRRIPLIIKIRPEDFDIAINSGYLDKEDYSDYTAWMQIKGSFAKLAKNLDSNPGAKRQIESNMTTPIIEAHRVVEQGIKPDRYEGMTDEEILALEEFKDYGKVMTAQDIWEEALENHQEEEVEEYLLLKEYSEVFTELWVAVNAEDLVTKKKTMYQMATFEDWKKQGCSNAYDKNRGFYRVD